jgi:hypothetical protein
MSDAGRHFALRPDHGFDPIEAMTQLTNHVGQLAAEVAYLRRTLGMVQGVLPYPKAKRGGCAKARKFINEAIGGGK